MTECMNQTMGGGVLLHTGKGERDQVSEVEAKIFVGQLTQKEKAALYDLLSSLAQRPSPSEPLQGKALATA